MTQPPTESDLEAYLNEALTPPEMASIEAQLRSSPQLLQRLARILSRWDAGAHSLGDIWRRHRISCASREELGRFLLGVLDDAHARYIRFHLDEVACRLCHANLLDLRRNQAEPDPTGRARRKKYFDSGAGYLQGG